MKPLTKLLRIVHTRKKEKTVPLKKELTLIPYTPTSLSDEQKFKQHLILLNTTCWEWSGTLDRYGYGVFKNGRKSIKAHRYSYELHYGNFDKKLR